MGSLGNPLWVLAGLAGVLVLLLAGYLIRRVALTRASGAFACALRRPRPAGTAPGGWIKGIAGYGPGELQWFRLVSLAPRPSCTWRRTDLTITRFGAPQEQGDAHVLGQGTVVVACTVGDDEIEIAMSVDAYIGFASWVEAAPPGQHARVT